MRIERNPNPRMPFGRAVAPQYQLESPAGSGWQMLYVVGESIGKKTPAGEWHRGGHQVRKRRRRQTS